MVCLLPDQHSQTPSTESPRMEQEKAMGFKRDKSSTVQSSDIVNSTRWMYVKRRQHPAPKEA